MTNFTSLLKRAILAGALAALSAPAFAQLDLVGDDTDLFMRNPNVPSSIPNVLIVLDNTSNWASSSQGWNGADIPPECLPPAGNLLYLSDRQGDAEVCALYKVINSTIVGSGLRVGLMMYHQGGASRPAGGYVRFPMTRMDSSGKSAFNGVLKLMATTGPYDHSPSSAHTIDIFNDSFRYFNSKDTLSGIIANSPGGPENPPAAAGGYLTANMQKFNFPADALDNSCGNDYIIFIGNGPPTSDTNYGGNNNQGLTGTDFLTGAAALLNDTAVQPKTSVILNTGMNFDVWARFLYDYGTKVPGTSGGVYRHITTHTINVCKDLCTQNTGWLNWESALQSAADVSNGIHAKASSLEAIINALNTAFSAIQAKNTVFAATTLPVSINVRGTNLNQVYIGVFRPDGNLSPRWWGNLKQYQLGIAAGTTSLELKQADAVTAAVNPNTGFIFTDATSLWTHAVGTPGDDTGFWKSIFRAPYDLLDAGKDQDAPDGDLVEKGGAAQQIREVYPVPDSTVAQTRKIYTCTGLCADGDTLSSYLFNKDNNDIASTNLGTFVTQSVASITASGQTATVTIASNNFAAGDQVVISGASPNLFNSPAGSYFTVLASPAPTGTQFSYSVAPSTPDYTHAYVTFAAPYTLTPGTDLITITGSTPTDYNVTDAAISFVNSTQFSYLLPASVTLPATGFTATGVRRVTAGNLVYSTATSRATVTLANHGYGNLDQVTISGATPAEFNGLYSIAKIDDGSFMYVPGTPPSGGAVTQATAVTAAPSGFGWTTGDRVAITNGGASVFNTATTPAPGGSTISGVDVVNNTFTYTTGGSPTAGQTISPATGFTAQRVSVSDKNTWTPGNPTLTGPPNKSITLALTSLQILVPGQAQHQFAVGDSITVNGLTCTRSNGNSNPCRNGGTAGETTFTVTLTAATNGSGTASVTFLADNNTTAGTWQSPQTVVWSASSASPSYSAAVTVSSLVAGQATVTATGTIYASKTGDLLPTSITSQGTATGTITAAHFGSSDIGERVALIDWIRGIDNKENENKNLDNSSNPILNDVRASVHGDVLHSRPAVVNYNRDGTNNDVYVFYGANDGMLHAIKGGVASDGGKEQWTFVAPEFFGRLKRLRDQLPRISSQTPRDYFFDGSIAVYARDANKDAKIDKTIDANDKVFLFVTMRRGGRMLYAFDVTDPTAPVLKWRKGCREATGSGTTVGTGDCDAGFGEMGQTWGQPQLGYLRKWPTTLALIVGAGYDKAVEDFQPCAITAWSATSVTAVTGVVMPTTMDTASCPPSGGTSVATTRSQGRGVYILNAETGAILWTAGRTASGATKEVAGMDYSIVGDIAALRNRSNQNPRADDLGNESVPVGYFDRLYAADTGGNVWRIDVADISDGANTATPPDFQVHKLAAISATPPVTGTPGNHAAVNYRKFSVQTDVVYSSDAISNYDAVLVGSGDREHVWDFVVQNRFYMFKDRNTTTLTASDTPQATIGDSSTDLYVATGCLQDSTLCGASNQAADQLDLLNKKGWRLALSNTGEKTVAPATTAAGTVIFNTHQPKEDTITGQGQNVGNNAANACTAALGTARQYGINYKDATATNIFTSLPANQVSQGGAVAVFAGGGFLPQPVPAVVQIGGNYYQTVIAGVQTTNPGGLTLQSRVRTYWYRRTD